MLHNLRKGSQSYKLYQLFLARQGQLILYNELEQVAGVDTRQEVYQIVNSLREHQLADIRKVYAEGYIYRGSQLE